MTGWPSVMRGRWRRQVAAAAALCWVWPALAPAALADTAPTRPDEPATVTAQPLPTVQINGVVWSQVVIGTTVYAAGNFTKTRPAGSPAGSIEVDRTHLLAFDIAPARCCPASPPASPRSC